MVIAIKDTKVIAIHEVEWQCRRNVKGLDKSAYWTWLESVTTEGVPDYSGENYEIVETEVDIQGFNASGHITNTIDGTSYHLKWDASKKK